MADQLLTQNTYVAVMTESVAGEYETPTDSDFMPILDAFSPTSGYDTVDNTEMIGTLDKRPSRRTMQNGQVAIPLYLKGGGSTDAPHYDQMLRAAFGTPSAPISGSDKATSGNAALATVEASPAPTSSQFDIATAAAFLEAGDVILVDVSGDGSGSYEQATVLSATFDTDHETVVLTAALAGGAPTAGNAVQLISRVDIAASPGLSVGDVIAVDVTHGATAEYECVLVIAVTGTTTQTCDVWPYFSQEPLDGATVVGGHTYAVKDSGHDTNTISVFRDCNGQDGVRYDYAGCRPNLQIQNAETGNMAELLFTYEVQKWQVSSSGTNLSTLGLTPDTGPTHDPPICVGSVIVLGGSRETIHTQKLEVDMGYTITKRMSMIPCSGVRSTRFKDRMVNGVFDLDLTDATQYDAWGDGTRSPLLFQFWDDDQTIVGICPYIKRTNVEDQDSDGIQTQNITWQADPDDTLKTFYLAFLPGGLAPTC